MKAIEPDALAHLRNPDILTGEDVAEIDLPPVEAIPSALRHRERRVMERVWQVLEPAIDARRADVDVGRHLH